MSVDYPARAFETGQQVGGNYSCPCGIPTPDHKNLAKVFSQRGMSLSERELKLKDGVIWRTQSTGILKNAIKRELLRETQARDLYAGTCYQRATRAGLMQQLVHDLHGVHRLPALLLGAPSQDILSICPQLEVSFCEVLHDFLGLMENLTEELPQHVPALEAVFASLRAGRDRLRAVDARFLAISFAHYATCDQHVVPEPVRHLAQLLVEISEICYGFSCSLSPRSILRLYNVTLSIGMLMKDIVGDNPTKVSPGRFYGIHYHGITAHLADMYRIVPTRSFVPEQEEATFYRLKQIVQRTSSRHPQNVVDNFMARQPYTEELPQHVPALEVVFASLRAGRDRLWAVDARFLAISFAHYATCDQHVVPEPVRHLAQLLVEISGHFFHWESVEQRTGVLLLSLI